MTADRWSVVPAALRICAAVALAALVTLTGSALPARAASSGNEITRYDVAATLAADGTMGVVLDFDFDFGSDPGHGPYLTLPTSQGYDETQDRVFEYSDVAASSDDPAAAPDDVDVEEENGWLQVRIGDEDVDDVEGVHRYVVTYRVRGFVNGADSTGAGDELFWNVIGDRWEIPLGNVTVDVNGPGSVEQVACFAGSGGARSACGAAAADGTSARFAQEGLLPGQPLTIVAGYPAGTFADVAPLLREKWSPARAFALTPFTGLAGGLVLVGGVGFAVARVRQRGRDAQYLDQVPGFAPLGGHVGAVVPRDRRSPIAVHFTPPAGFQVGQIGTLIDEKADPRDVTATIVDLAVRGYLRIEQTEPADSSDPEADDSGTGAGSDWRLVRLRAADDALLGYERTLFNDIFAAKSSVRLSDLKTTFAGSMASVQKELYEDVTARGWFRGNPSTVRLHWYLAGVAITVLGLLATFTLAAFTHWGLLGVASLAVGITLLFVAGSAPARTADGTAVLAQTLGFRQYLATAEAAQITFEEGEDVFSRYLPYAIVFGLAERWAAVFAELARQGRAVAEPTWYTGPGYHAGAFWVGAGSFGQAIDSFSAIATESMAAATPGSSGGSGFSGGSVGGGVGGGGGGGW